MTAIAKLPVFMRIGDGPEIEVGAIVPEMGDLALEPDGTARCDISAPSMADFLRAAADAFEARERGGEDAAETAHPAEAPA